MPPHRPILRTRLLGSVLATCAAVVPLPAQDSAPQPTEQPLLWCIEGTSPCYIYGTVHVSDPRVLALPRAVLDALDEASIVYTETPPASQASRDEIDRLFLPAGETLGSIMPGDLRSRLAEHLDKRGHSLRRYEKLNLWAVTLQATMIDEVKSRAERPPLDEVLHQRAVAAGKGTGALETVSEHLDIFEQLTPEQHLAWLRSTLDLLDTYEARGYSPSEQLVRLYLDGDEDALREHVTQSFPTDPELRALMVEELIDRRNERMARRIVDTISTDRRKSHFFAIGAGHLSGKRGILRLIEKHGYKPKRVETEAHRREKTKFGELEDMLRDISDQLRALNRRVDRLEKRIDRLEERRR